jgi:hypothetical protein
MLNKLYEVLNAISVTAWIVVIYAIKEKWTFDERIPPLAVSVVLTLGMIGVGALSLFLTRFLGKGNLEKCAEVEQADSSFLPSYIGYFLVAFSISNTHQLLVAFVFISIFIFFIRWQTFNVTYIFWKYHCYHVTTEKGTKLFVLCQREIRSTNDCIFQNLRRINNTTYIERRN